MARYVTLPSCNKMFVQQVCSFKQKYEILGTFTAYLNIRLILECGISNLSSVDVAK